MVKAKDLSFIEPKKLPSLQTLVNDFGIDFNAAHQRFHKKVNNPALLSVEGIYPLADFVLDYYEMEFGNFKRKFERLLHCKLKVAILLGKIS